jgi:mono/diheme cytochrome c family protein
MKTPLRYIDRNSNLLDKKWMLAAATLFIILINLLTSSCGTARRSEPIMGTMMTRNEHIDHGEMVFINNCQKCHPGGEAGLGPPINNIPIPGFALRFRVRNKAFLLGLGRMPSFKKHEINRSDMDDLVAYLHALKKNDEDAHDSNRGKRNYRKLSAKSTTLP